MLPLLPRAPELVIIHTEPPETDDGSPLASSAPGSIILDMSSETRAVVACQMATTCV